MSIVRVEEEIQPLKYLVITQERDPESVITTNVIISDTRFNRLNLVSIEKGPQGDTGAQGPAGPAGQDGVSFEILPINSGGTNNTSFSSGNIIYYDGNKLSSSNYTFEDLLNSSNANAVTGVFSGSGLYRELVDNTVTLGINAGGGLAINEYNQIVVDDTIVRKVELSIGNITGVVPIDKGGTNNQTFNSNRLLYYDGFKITSFPLATGRILLSGTTIDIVAGSGLTGGGSLTLPSGSVVLNIGGSSDILVENNSISLSVTGTPGTYSKIITDDKGRVVSGTNLTQSDIISILGYTPWHPGNDGQDSGLDADLLDGNNSSYFTNAGNLTGFINLNIVPSSVEPGTYTKVYVNDRGMVALGDNMNYGDIVYSLGYRPVSTTGDTINGSFTVNGDVNLNGDDLTIRDNLPTIGTNSASILPSDPRGFTFLYGGFIPKTGILAFYPADRELKLITNISSSGGEISGGENGFIGDVDGGDQNAIYISNNVSGDINVILLRGKADTLYVSRTDNQVISGVKTFVNGIQIRDQIVITPIAGQSNAPINVGNNSRMVENLNVDLLHGRNSDYFTDAGNMTGLFTYEKVEFDNLDGTPDYIPRFDNRTSDPSRTISDSIIRQKADDTAIIIENNASLHIGSSNSGSFLVNSSAAIGTSNKVFNNNSLAVGTNNIVSGNNSVALNYGSKTLKNKSIAAGNYGYTWSENQLSFGAFAEFDNGQTITQGQYSTIALGLNSSETNGSWTDMSPSIILPKDKTIAYSLEVLMNKAAGTGAALVVFDSGIIKNTTFRNPSNPAQTVNVTSSLKNHAKKEIYNDSQQRRHYYHYKLADNTIIQNLEVTAPPVKSFGVSAQNIDSIYKYIPEFISSTGSYVKTNDGNTILTIEKPVFSGSFLQNSNDYRIKVTSYNHGMTTGCLASLTFSSGLFHNPISKQYTVLDIIDQDHFRVSENFASGYLTGDEIVIDPNSKSLIDSSGSIIISGGYLYTNSPDMYNMPLNAMTILHTGMKVRFRPYESLYPTIAEQTGIIVALTSGSVTFNVPFTGTFNSSSVNSPSVLTFNSYTDHYLSSCSKLYVNIDGYGQQALTRISGAYPATYCGQPTIAFKITGVPQNFSGTPVKVAPGSLNSGLLTLHNKRSFNGTYAKSATRFKKYDGIYTQYPSEDGTSTLSIYNKYLENITLPSTPFSYSLVCGYGDADNASFAISGDYLVARESFNFEAKSAYTVRVRTTDRSSQFLEKRFTIGILNVDESPFLMNPIDDQYLTVDEPWVFMVPTGTFSDETFAGSKSYSGCLSNNSGLPSWLSFNGGQRIFSGTPSLSDTGVLSLKVNVFYNSVLAAYDIFDIHINESGLNIFNYSIQSIDDDSPLKITNLNLSAVTISENMPSGSVIGKFDTAGGYSPHLRFETASNSFSGVLINNSNIISECASFSLYYPTTTLLGRLDTIYTGMSLSATNGLSSATITGILNSLVEINGYTSSGSNRLCVASMTFPDLQYISGIRFVSSLSEWNNQSRVANTGQNFITFDRIVFSGNQDSASNKFSGVLINNSNIISECTSVLGDLNTLIVGMPLSTTSGLSLASVTGILESVVEITGYVSSGSYVISGITPPDLQYISGVRFISSLSEWNDEARVVNTGENSLIFDIPFTGTGINTTITVNNIGKRILLDTRYQGESLSGIITYTAITINNIGKRILLDTRYQGTSRSGLITYTGVLPTNDEYYPSGFQYFASGYVSGVCPSFISQSYIKGFSSETSQYIASTGHYVTGIVSFYTEAGCNDIIISPDQHTNIESNEDSIFINYTSTNQGDIPTDTAHTFFSGYDGTSSFMVNNLSWYPDSGLSSTGSMILNLDKNHGYQILNAKILNQIPVQFDSCINNNSNRKPKNNLFDILAITGNQITINDNQNYLLKENSKPDYFEQPIRASYSTNGFNFNSTIVSGNNSFYDCDSAQVFNLQRNMILGCSSLGSVQQPVRVDSVISGISFNGTVYSGQSILTTSTGLSLYQNQRIYSSLSGWSDRYIYISSYSASSGIIALSRSIDWIMDTGIASSFYTLPIITVNQNLCVPYNRQQNNRTYYNGNIIIINGLSTPKAYLNADDQIKITTFNGSNNFNTNSISQYCQILRINASQTLFSGIAMNGSKNIEPLNQDGNDLYRRNQYRYSDSFGLAWDTELPNVGSLSFIGSCSGFCNIPYFNNIYYHSYGGSTAEWPMDNDGNFVSAPKTGVFTIGVGSSSCQSGTICINIKGFENTDFNNISDIIDRSNIGKTSNITNDNKGYIRPWGTNKKFYFDFSDGAPLLNGSYYITDKIDPYNFTITIPYNAAYFGVSGLVYIIDSDYNLKSNKNPNINNDFIVSNGSINVSGTDNSLFALGINSYNDQSKRWKHLIHLNNSSLPIYSGYTATLHNQINTQLLYLNPNNIEIIGLDYSLDYGQTYSSILESNSLDIPHTFSKPVYLRIQTKNGSEKWSQSLSKSAPRVNIFGIANYSIDNDNIIYNPIDKIWIINIIITDITEILSNRDMIIKVSDETGFDTVSKSINIQFIPQIREALPSYVYANGPDNWSLVYDIKYLPETYTITMSGFPGSSFTIGEDNDLSNDETKIIYGYPGSITGIYYPVLYLKDSVDNILSTSTGEIHILGPSQYAPSYQLNPVGLDDNIYLNIDNSSQSSSFYFYVPAAVNQEETSLTVTLAEAQNYYGVESINYEYSTADRYKVTVALTGNTGYYPNKNIGISIFQPVIDENSVITWTQYTYNKNINLTLYKNFQINTSALTQPLVYDKQEMWSIQFNLVNGILSHRSDIHPTVRLGNLPNIGTYENQPLEYSLNYTYDAINYRWNVEAIGKTDTFGKVTDNIGPKTINIYADDTQSVATRSVNLLFTQTEYLDNIQSTIYSVPNKAYQNTFDIKQADVDTYPSVTIPINLKENTINLSRYYRKYDPNFNLWEYSYSGEPIVDRWDIDIDISNTGTSLSSSQFSTITAKCKGIATDKIQAVGKLSLIELDSFSIGGLPIKITGISYPSYTIVEGSPWDITFKTIFGLENPNFPPTILLSGLPSMCSGYNPSIGLEQQNTCLQYRTWNPIDKSWNFKFKGLPLCGQEGIKPFSILAIDTDTIQDIYLTSDKIGASILYTSLEDNGFSHTPPVIRISGSQQDQNPIQLSPLCNSPINISYIFGPTNRESCAIPTGITGWMVSGTLPPGLSYAISFSGGNPSAPWNNLSSGIITFTGNPTTFANGSLYSQQFGLKVFDARNKSTQRIFTFQDISSANPPSPLNLTVYFDDEKPKYTPIRNMVAGETVSPPQGTRPIDKGNYPNITTYWPPAYSGSLNCTSILPHNQCQTCEFYYSGGNYEELDYKVYLQFSRQLPISNISEGNNLYLEFDYNPTGNKNGFYSLKYSSPNYYVEVPGQTFTTGSGRLVRERKVENVPTYDLQKFNGSLDSNTTKSILGCGSFSNKTSFQILDESGYGLFGRMRPDYSASIPVSGIFSNSDASLTGLNIVQLNNQYTSGISNHIYTVKTYNCWETGYLRISGILLPAPIVELTDPAPASEAPFAYNNQQYYVGSRCAYGNTAEQRDLQDNKRDTTINYRITNLLTNSVYQNSQVGSNQAIAFNHSEAYGTVFSLFLNNNPATFPTYRYNALRYAQNEYFWIHKGGTKNGTITQNSFPPVMIDGIINNKISCLSGVSISGYEGILVGGYIPFNEYPIPVPYYQLPDNSNWTTLSYNPHATGFITKEIENINNPIALSYSHPGNTQPTNQYINISIGANTYGFASGDAVRITFAEDTIPPTSLLLEPVNFSGSFIRIPYNRGGSPAITNSQAYISYRSILLSIDDNTLTIKHKNIPFITGENVDITQGSISTCSNIAPYNYKTIVSSGDSSLLYVSFNGPNSVNYSGSLAVSGITQVNRIWSNQINIAEPTYSKEGYWLFSITGTPTGLYRDYSYKIISVENTGMPVFSGTSLTPKTYSRLYPLYINKPLKINLPQTVIDSGIVNNNGSWSLTFNTDGGLRPIYNNKPEVMINGEICNFNRQLSAPNMLDTYDASTDSWQIVLTNNTNFDWRNEESFELMIFDETGFDIKTINLL